MQTVSERLAPAFRSDRFRNSPAPLHSSQAFTGPSVRLELCDRASAMKHLVECGHLSWSSKRTSKKD